MNKQDKINDLFRQARKQVPEASFEETKDLFLKSRGSQTIQAKNNKGLIIKNRIIMSTIIGIIGIAASLLLIQKPEQAKKNLLSTKKAESKTKKLIQINQAEKIKTGILKAHNKQTINTGFADEFNLPENVETIDIEPVKESGNVIKKDISIVYKPSIQDEYIFPKLTEKEMQKTNKQKKKMLKALAKHDSKVYSYIPSGSFDYNGKMVSVQAFYMQNTEVSNLEYRTFLFDLLIQDRKAEFLKAKPDQQQWVKILGESYLPMQNAYFSNEGFNEYPVVNISREGAEMYCMWLNKELSKFVGAKKQNDFNDLRLPLRGEWAIAATAHGNLSVYPWKSDSRINERGSCLANFSASDKNVNQVNGHQPMQKYAFPPSFFGLWNLCGNVAEMVYNDFDDRNSHGTVGGGWMNTAEELKIYAPDNYPDQILAHPNIGFRPVMTFVRP